MANYKLTCDSVENLARCAVWQGKTLVDLYIDLIDRPDWSGALVQGKVMRIKDGGRKAWVSCPFNETLYCESAKPLRVGEVACFRILSAVGEGKAWPARRVDNVNPPLDGLGVIEPPPPVWARALSLMPEEANVSLVFEQEEDASAFAKTDYAMRKGVKGTYHWRGDPVHPDLSDVLDTLVTKEVPLSGGSSLIIEETAACVAIDVNAGEAANPLAVNLLAVREVARQVRLRNLSGLILVDCLKMSLRADASKVVHAVTRVFEDDFRKVQIYGVSKAGILEISRQRLGPSLPALHRKGLV